MSYGFTMKIPKGAYQKALKRVQAADRVFRAHKGKGGVPAEKLKGKGTNRDRAVVELYKFQNKKAAKPFMAYLKGRKVTNWTGLRMCDVTSRSSGRSGFPDISGRRSERVTITAKCVDGHTYVGRGPGDGMYIRMTPKKGRK